jgi:hypothetical protein
MVVEYSVDESCKKPAKEYINTLQTQLALIRDAAMKVQELSIAHRLARYNTEAETVFKNGDYVLLQRTHDNNPGKLEPIWLGPYKILHLVAPSVYRLQHIFDPERVMDIHHMRLRPFVLREDVTPEELETLVGVDDNRQLVERVITHSGFNKRNIRFTIKWVGLPESENTDEPWSHVYDCQPVLDYIQSCPELHHLLRVNRRDKNVENETMEA